MSTKPVPQSSYMLLWAGENPALHDALLEELDSAGIPYSDKALGDEQVAPTADPLPIDWKPRFGFEVTVPSRHLPVAQQILEKLLDEGDLADVEIPAEDGALAEEEASTEASTTAEQATVGVWAGSDRRIRQFITAALQENEIPIRIDDNADQTVVYVPPSHAKRAREIIREITEGVPPE